MKLNELRPPAGAKKEPRRIGRGNGSGQGTTAGKGTKGQKARSGGAKANFRGMSSRDQRYGKARGFTNIFKVDYALVKVGDLAAFDADATIDAAALRHIGLVKGGRARPVKLLGDGSVGKPLIIRLDKVSQSARVKIEGAGGRVEEVSDAASGA